MQAAVLHAAGDLRLESRDVPELGQGDVLVRVTGCGVCGSDATEYARGPVLTELPVVLGHEFAGVVERTGPGVDIPVGAAVVCGAGVSCGRCKPCRQGRTNLCRRYRTLGLQVDGGLAEYVRAPASTLLDVTAAGLEADTLALAQPMAIAVHAASRGGAAPERDVVIIGIGGIGAFLTFAVAAAGARVLAVDRNPERLELARALGASETLLAGEETLVSALARLGWEPDVFFEVSGSRAGWDAVIEAALPGATLVPVGIQREEIAIPVGSWTLREYTMVGTVAHVRARDLPRAVELLASREDWSDVAPEVLPLSEVVDGALGPIVAGSHGAIKTVVDPRITERRPARHGATG